MIIQLFLSASENGASNQFAGPGPYWTLKSQDYLYNFWVLHHYHYFVGYDKIFIKQLLKLLVIIKFSEFNVLLMPLCISSWLGCNVTIFFCLGRPFRRSYIIPMVSLLLMRGGPYVCILKLPKLWPLWGSSF